MDKYTIDDLIIDDPASGTGKSGRKPKRKFTTIIAFIVIIVVAGVFLSKIEMGSPADINSTEEMKAEDDTMNELLEPKQEKSASADDLSIAINELDSLAIPKTEPIKNEIVTAKTDELIDQKQEGLIPEESAEKTADELSIAGTETKTPEPTISEPKSGEIAVAETDASTDQKQEISPPGEQESKKIADTLSITDTEANKQDPSTTESKNVDTVTSGAEKFSETEQKTNEAEKQASVKISDVLSTTDTAEAKSTTNLSNEPEADTLKNERSKIVDPQDKPKQEIKSKTTKTPDTKTEDIALKKKKEKEKIAAEKRKKKKEKEKKEKIAAEKKKVKSKPKTKSKQDGFFSTFSNNGRYYILVGSNPSSKLLSKIKNSRLHYLIRKSGGKRSVFIGPYRSSSDAKRSISKVRKATGVRGVVVKAK